MRTALHREWGAPVCDVVTAEEWSLIERLRESTGFDVCSQPTFWEMVVARYLGGRVTRHRCTHDVELESPTPGVTWNLEVKFSQAMLARQGQRAEFKWAKPRGGSGKWSAHAVLLTGRDVDGMVFSWLIPTQAIAARCPSITIVAPSSRVFRRPGQWDRFAVPFEQLLPAFLRVCRAN